MTQVALKTVPIILQEGGGRQKEKHPTVCRLNDLHQSFVGSQPSAKDLLIWNWSANYIVTGGFKSLARKCNKINKNQLGSSV